MELRSSRVLKKNTTLVDGDSVDEKTSSMSSDKSERGETEVEIRVCVDNADENLECSDEERSRLVSMSSSKNRSRNVESGKSEAVGGGGGGYKGCRGKNGRWIKGHRYWDKKKKANENLELGIINTDDKLLFPGSEVLDPIKDSIVSCPEREIEENSIEIVRVECSDEERNGSSENGESEKFSGDDKGVLAAVLDGSVLNCSENGDSGRDENGRWKIGHRRCNKRNNRNTSPEKMVVGSGGDGGLIVVGRKRKNVEGLECNGEGGAEEGGTQVNGRVLRSRIMAGGGGGIAVGGGASGEVIGLKRMAGMEAEADSGRPKKKRKRRGRPRKVQALQGETMPESSQRRPKKKRKGRGRPRKFPIETLPENANRSKKIERRGRPRKFPVETLPENAHWSKKIERRGRPRKVPFEILPEDAHRSNIPVRKLERRGRPRKIPVETLPENAHLSKILVTKIERRGRPRKDMNHMIFMKLKRRGRGRPPKMQAMNIASHVIKMRTVNFMAVKKSDRRSKGKSVTIDRSPERGGEPLENRKRGGGKEERRKKQQLVRDQIMAMLLAGGWTIDRRPRPGRVCKDAVYIEPNGRTHWSVTKAYTMLKKKIEDGKADSNEIAAFVPIPDDEMSRLVRIAIKGRCSKKMKKLEMSKMEIKITKYDSKRKVIRKTSTPKPKCNESRKPLLLARRSEKESDQDNEKCSIYSRKRNLLAWMIDSGVVPLGRKVRVGKSKKRQKRASTGVITSDGIRCGCCDKTMGLSEFVDHAGGKGGQPLDNVFLDNGVSLRKCLGESWRKEAEVETVGYNLVDVKGDDPNDDTCNICGDGGDLVCCDTCPSTFHQSCLDIQNFPPGDWNCIYCSCKFCRAVSSDDSCDSEMLSCCLCEEKFHRSCREAADTVSGTETFCGRKCEELFERLQTYLGVKFELEEGFSWTLLQRSDIGQDFGLHDTQKKIECNSKLAVAFTVMDECFVSIVDERSGTNIIHNAVYNCGSNIRRLNFSGFFTAILEKGDELVSAASIRIHGHRLAEMPFIGTRHVYRRQGMCRRLLDAIESTLSSVGVEELVIPAIPELLQTWTRVFGFVPTEEPMKQAMKSMSMIVFPGIDMLQKPLFRNQTPSASDEKAMECVTRLENVSSDVIDCKQTFDDVAAVDKDDVDDVAAVDKDATDELAAVDKDAADDVADADKEDADDVAAVDKDAADDVAAVDKDAADEDVRPLENNESSAAHKANGLYDLNIPANDVSKIPALISDGCVVKNDHGSPESLLDCDRSPELESGVENDGVLEVKESPIVVPKNTFDLNLQPTGIETDVQTVDGIEPPRVCTNPFELSDPAPRAENGAVGLPDSNAQPLVIL